MKKYTTNFYDDMMISNITNNRSSANEIVPIVMKIVQPRSVVDVGCAVGLWLDSFKKIGKVKTILGIDGAWVDKNKLRIPKSDFKEFDLEKKINIKGKFDLVISLEVAEHISKENANQFVDNLVGLGNCILFSAAIPNQGGINHVNEQWQSYWINKFKVRKFVCLDCIRPEVWSNSKVAPCYAQNMFLFYKEGEQSSLNMSELKDSKFIADCVHPRIYSIGVTNEQNLRHIARLQLNIIKVLKEKIINVFANN